MAWHGMAIAWPGPRAWVPGEGKEGMATGQDGRRQDETRQDETRCREGSSFQPTYHLPSLPSIPFPWFPAGAPREPVRARPAPRERATSGRAGGWRLANCACIGCSAQVIQCGRNLKRANCLYLPSSLSHLANHSRRRVPHHSVMEAQPDGSQKKKSPWMAAVAERNWAGQARQGSCGRDMQRAYPGKQGQSARVQARAASRLGDDGHGSDYLLFRLQRASAGRTAALPCLGCLPGPPAVFLLLLRCSSTIPWIPSSPPQSPSFPSHPHPGGPAPAQPFFSCRRSDGWTDGGPCPMFMPRRWHPRTHARPRTTTTHLSTHTPVPQQPSPAQPSASRKAPAHAWWPVTWSRRLPPPPPSFQASLCPRLATTATTTSTLSDGARQHR